MKKLALTMFLVIGGLWLYGQTTHFIPAFEGNGLDHMNIYVIGADISGIPLEAGDEIAAFDGEICCAVLTLSGTVSSTSLAVLRASMADPGEENGFTSGHPITLKFWDASAAKEYDNVELTFYNTSQEIISPVPYIPGESAFVTASGSDVEPDITPGLTVAPNIMNGATNFEVLVRVSEVNGAATTGAISVVIPRDSRLTFTWNPALTLAVGETVHNAVWSYTSTDPNNHIFTTSEVIPANGILRLGIQALFNPGATRGKSTVTAQITSGSGGDSRPSNNSDSEIINYFGE